MKSEFDPRLTGWLLAGLVLISAAAQADNGFTIATSRENVVAIGMSTSEVQQLLGRPARADRYRNMPGPVWTYRVVDPLFGRTEFNVEFGTSTPGVAFLTERCRELLDAEETTIVLGGDPPVGLGVLFFRPSLWSHGLEAYLRRAVRRAGPSQRRHRRGHHGHGHGAVARAGRDRHADQRR